MVVVLFFLDRILCAGTSRAEMRAGSARGGCSGALAAGGWEAPAQARCSHVLASAADRDVHGNGQRLPFTAKAAPQQADNSPCRAKLCRSDAEQTVPQNAVATAQCCAPYAALAYRRQVPPPPRRTHGVRDED